VDVPAPEAPASLAFSGSFVELKLAEAMREQHRRRACCGGDEGAVEGEAEEGGPAAFAPIVSASVWRLNLGCFFFSVDNPLTTPPHIS
jgi:hypothetical protein